MVLKMWPCAVGALLVGCAIPGPQVPVDPQGELPENPAVEVHRGAAPPPSYAGLRAPGASPVRLLPQISKPGQIEHSAVFSPDLQRLFFTASDASYRSFTVMTMTRRGDSWSEPLTAHFSGRYSDHGTFFSPRGDELLLSSTRPLPGSSEEGTWHLWSLTNSQGVWGDPAWIRLPGVEDQWQSHGSLTRDGTLYLHLWAGAGSVDGEAPATPPDFDIYRARPSDDGYETPVKLGPAINTPGIEVTAWVARDESFMLFAAYDRPDGYGGGDLYVSFSKSSGEWGPARNLGPTINSAAQESNPTLTADQQYLIFSSSRQPSPATGSEAETPGLHLYWVRADVLKSMADDHRRLAAKGSPS